MNVPFIKCIRGRGLLNAIVIDESFDKSAWDICILLKKRGLLAKPTHDSIIRLVIFFYLFLNKNIYIF